MKTKIIIPVVTALVLSACSLSYLAKTGNDDLYYTPSKGSASVQKQDEPTVPAVQTNSKVVEKSNTSRLSDYEKYRNSLEQANPTDTTVSAGKNYADNSSVENPADSKEPDVESSDYYGDGNDTYVYNNYYYAGRINRFHSGFYNPYFYDPFYYDSWYDPWYSSGWGFSIGFGWGYPYYYDYYYPSFGSWGYYGYNPYWGGYYHGYYHGFNDGYGYGGRGYYGYNNGYYRGFNLRSANNASTRSYPVRSLSSQRTGMNGGVSGRSYTTRAGGVNTSGRAYTSSRVSGESGGGRQVYTRRITTDENTRNYNGSRRVQSESTQSSAQRTYTPSYSKPRTYSRPSYNETSSSSSSYSRGSNYSGNSGSSSRSSETRSYNNSSSRSYNSGSSYSSGSRSSSSYTPSSSSSSGSSGGYSSGGSSHSSGGGSSSRSSSGGRR